MIICDTSVLVAAINSKDDDHKACAATLRKITHRLVTTLPCITETMYLLGKNVGYPGQEVLRGIIGRGALQLYYGSHENTNRSFDLMRIYADAPMDFADASLVVLAEVLKTTQILTLDRHFYSYRIENATPFDVIPLEGV